MADDDLDNGVDAAAAALKPHTLAEVSGAVPQTPPCYVARPEETSRLVSALDPEYDGYAALGGATTVIFDSVANGKRYTLKTNTNIIGYSFHKKNKLKVYA